MNAIFYPAIFHPEESGYSVEIPDIEGCFTQGDTMDEAVRMAQDAIGLGRLQSLPGAFCPFCAPC